MGPAPIPFHSSFVPFDAAAIEQSIPQRFHQQVDSHPDHPAIVTPSRQLSYLELDRQANQVAAALLQQSDVANEPVGLLLPHDAAMAIAILGVLKAGKVYVILDRRLPPARLKQILEETGASHIVCEASCQEQARHLIPARVSPICMEDMGHFTAERPAVRVGPDHLCYILFTTGSTGQPKGVYQNHRNILHHVRTYTNAIGLAARDRLLLLNSFSFVRSISDLFGAILNGAATCLFDPREYGIGRLPEWIAAQRITVYNSVPTVFRQMASYLRPGQRFPDLRLLRLGGEQVRVTDVELYRKHFTPGCTLLVTLGTTETNTVCHHFLDERTEVVGPVVPIGHAVDGVEVFLLDEAGCPVPSGQVGQIAVRSQYLALGYWGHPEMTRAVFLSDPETKGFRSYRTGDLGQMLPDGSLVHLGRKDRQVKVRGHRIELVAIETALLQHPTIQEVAVVAREDRRGEQQLVAYFVARNCQQPSPSELRRQLAQTLPDYMIPSAFLPLPALPLTPTGKVDHRALPAWQPSAHDSTRVYEAPATDLEKLLTQLWQKSLGIKAVGVTDDFFELGGTSLQAGDLFVRIRQKLGVTLPFVTLLENPTIRSLAQALRRETPSWSMEAVVPIQGFGSKPPLFCVHGGWGIVFSYYELARFLGPDQPVYGLQPPGMSGGRGFDWSVAEMAARYVKEILVVQPHEPYLLCGHSFGGIVAFEMAQQLRRQGREAIFVGLLDTSLPELGCVSSVAIKTRHHLKNLAKLGMYRRLRYLARMALDSFHTLVARRLPDFFKILYCRLVLALRRPLPLRLQMFYYFRQVALPSKNAYVPQMYAGQLTLFLNRGSYVSQPESVGPDLGWGRFAGGGLVIVDMPGRHGDMLKEPVVQLLAERLKECLKETCNCHSPTDEADARNVVEQGSV